MSDVVDFEMELQELATRYVGLPQSLRDGIEQLIDACGHYHLPGGEP